jgi:four helix bundle protein
MDEAEFKRRTKKLSIDVISLVRMMERDIASDMVVRQLLRSASSVGANYRASCRAKSHPDIISKLSIVEEEADETMFWLEILAETGTLPNSVVEPIHSETEESSK